MQVEKWWRSQCSSEGASSIRSRADLGYTRHVQCSRLLDSEDNDPPSQCMLAPLASSQSSPQDPSSGPRLQEHLKLTWRRGHLGLSVLLLSFEGGTVFFHKRRSSWQCKPLGLPKCGMATFCASHKLRSFLKSQRSVAPQKLSDLNGFDVEPKNAFELP